MDDAGIIPEELEKVIEANKDYRPRQLTERKPYWGMLYVLASFQNPRGMCLPPGMYQSVCLVVVFEFLYFPRTTTVEPLSIVAKKFEE